MRFLPEDDQKLMFLLTAPKPVMSPINAALDKAGLPKDRQYTLIIDPARWGSDGGLLLPNDAVFAMNSGQHDRSSSFSAYKQKYISATPYKDIKIREVTLSPHAAVVRGIYEISNFSSALYDDTTGDLYAGYVMTFDPNYPDGMLVVKRISLRVDLSALTSIRDSLPVLADRPERVVDPQMIRSVVPQPAARVIDEKGKDCTDKGCIPENK